MRIRASRCDRDSDQVCHHCHQIGHIHPHCPNRNAPCARARPQSPLITPISQPCQRSVSPNEDPDYVTACCHWEGLPRPLLHHCMSNKEVDAAFKSWQAYILWQQDQERSPLRPSAMPPSPPLSAPTDFMLHGISHCGKCRNLHKYNHILWARGLISGYSCHCGTQEEV